MKEMKIFKKLLEEVKNFFIKKPETHPTFEEKVRAMSEKEFILAMVNGLKKKHVKIDMLFYGYSYEEICFGCAATNAICEINGEKFTKDNINSPRERSLFIKSNLDFLINIESAYNALRGGEIKDCNMHLKKAGLSIRIKNPLDICLPYLSSATYTHYLHIYEQLANDQEL